MLTLKSLKKEYRLLVAAASVVSNDIFSMRLPEEARMFTSEAKAIELVLAYI